MNRKITKSLCLSMAMILLITFIPLMKPIQAHAADYSAWISIFDPTYYASHYKDAADYAGNNVDLLWQHFIQVGIPNARQASAEFNVSIYIQNYPELQQMYGSDLMQYYIHYVQVGKAEGRNAKCLNATIGKVGTSVPDSFKAGYKYGDYQIYNMHAYENGLDGDRIWIEGTITGFNKLDITENNGTPRYVIWASVTTSEGYKCAMNLYDTADPVTNVNALAGLLNHKVCFAAEYVGYSDKYYMMMPFAIKIYDEASGNVLPTSYSYLDKTYYSTLYSTSATKNTTTASNQSKQTTTTTSGYESIYNTYAAKLNSYSGSSINDLAVICDEGVSKMAEYYCNHGGSYSTYNSWATKLQNVYLNKCNSLYGF